MADIIQSCDRLFEYVDGHTFDSFSQDYQCIDAVARNLEIIGEAVKNIPPETLSLRSEINWSDVAKLRDVIAHQYFRVKLTVVWDVIHYELDAIRAAAAYLFASLSEPNV